MKVDTEDCSEPWADSLSIRIQLSLGTDHSKAKTGDANSACEQSAPLARRSRFTRSSTSSLMALARLPAEAPIVLFTPTLVPAGPADIAIVRPPHGDPFESLGRELAKHHPNVGHVPYVPRVGFTETHRVFVLHSAAVIALVCEPERPLRQASLDDQHDFAEEALKALDSSGLKTAGGAKTFVLVQCATRDGRRRPHAAFENVIETPFYNEQTAADLAGEIFAKD